VGTSGKQQPREERRRRFKVGGSTLVGRSQAGGFKRREEKRTERSSKLRDRGAKASQLTAAKHSQKRKKKDVTSGWLWALISEKERDHLFKIREDSGDKSLLPSAGQ